MLLTDTFTKYCQNLNNNMGAAVQHMLAMDKKYKHLFPLQEQILRQRFTTNTPDDYAVVSPCLTVSLGRQPFADMTTLIVQRDLLPNFFNKETIDYICSSNPDYSHLNKKLAPLMIVHELLVWSTFDENVYLRQKQVDILRRQEEARAKLAAEKHKRHLQAVEAGKRAMAQIAADPKLSKRFLAGSDLTKQISKKQDEDFIKAQMKKLKNSALLRASFITNITKVL